MAWKHSGISQKEASALLSKREEELEMERRRDFFAFRQNLNSAAIRPIKATSLTDAGTTLNLKPPTKKCGTIYAALKKSRQPGRKSRMTLMEFARIARNKSLSPGFNSGRKQRFALPVKSFKKNGGRLPAETSAGNRPHEHEYSLCDQLH